MDQLLQIFDNKVLWISIAGWFAAQFLKVVFYACKNRKFSLERLMGAGGMPSSHSSTVCGMTVAVGRTYGLDSPLFAISLIVAFIVMYDATGVRRAAGEQARVLNRLLMEHDKAEAQKALKEFLGHTPLEVLGGAVLGIALGFLIPIA